MALEALRDVHVAGAIRIQAERQEGEPDVVRRERRHPGPVEALWQKLVHPGVAGGDLEVAVEDARLVGQEAIGQRFPPGDRLGRPIPERELGRPGSEIVRRQEVDDRPLILQDWSPGRVDHRPVALRGASDIHPAGHCDAAADSLIVFDPVIHG